MKNTEIYLTVSEVKENNTQNLKKYQCVIEEILLANKINDTIKSMVQLKETSAIHDPCTILFDYDENLVKVAPYNDYTYSFDSVIYFNRDAAELALNTLLRNSNYCYNRFDKPVNRNGYGFK